MGPRRGRFVASLTVLAVAGLVLAVAASGAKVPPKYSNGV
jgi:hypothetical protein